MRAQSYSDTRKIAPMGAAPVRPDGSPDDNDRVEIGPTALAFEEWAAAGIAVPNLARMREYRIERLAQQIQVRDLAGVLLFDPLNIRYASDTTNMQLWNTHNFFRACFVAASGYMIVWDYKASDLLTAYNPLVRETRSGAAMFYFVSGDKIEEDARIFAAEVADVIRDHSGSNKRLAVDKIMIHGLRALEAEGLLVLDGEEVMEKTRAIKGPDEATAMRCAMHGCEQAMYAMEATAQPGLTENEVWAVLHAENIKRGGEWIETRILSSGPRTNPWFQESGPRIIQNNELLAFDTDLIGCYGQCADISRTWFIGDGEPTKEQRRLYREAHAQIIENMALLAPGVSFRDLTFKSRPLPDDMVELRYSVMMHGVGLCDEWPSIKYRQDYREGAYDYALEPGMALCVEAYIGVKGGTDGIKLEDQVLITDDGYERVSVYPYDQKLMT